jgi:hypothetical protein
MPLGWPSLLRCLVYGCSADTLSRRLATRYLTPGRPALAPVAGASSFLDDRHAAIGTRGQPRQVTMKSAHGAQLASGTGALAARNSDLAAGDERGCGGEDPEVLGDDQDDG